MKYFDGKTGRILDPTVEEDAAEINHLVPKANRLTILSEDAEKVIKGEGQAVSPERPRIARNADIQEHGKAKVEKGEGSKKSTRSKRPKAKQLKSGDRKSEGSSGVDKTRNPEDSTARSSSAGKATGSKSTKS